MSGATLTNYDALLQLAASQVWMRCGRAKDGNWYGPGRLRQVEDFDKTLKNPSRKLALRLARMPSCYSCGLEVPLGGQGDHIISTATGGPHDLSNYAPMCSKCNSKKGVKDLMEWWFETGRVLPALHEDVIVAYCRVQYWYLAERGMLESSAPTHLIQLLDFFGESLPSPQHVRAFRSIRSIALFQLALPL